MLRHARREVQDAPAPIPPAIAPQAMEARAPSAEVTAPLAAPSVERTPRAPKSEKGRGAELHQAEESTGGEGDDGERTHSV